MAQNLDCPVDFILINENRVRAVAFMVLLLSTICLLDISWIIPAFLVIDFGLRAFNVNSYSPLAIISGWLIKALKIKNKPADRAPKRFAAFIGLSFMGFISIAIFLNLKMTAQALLAIIIIFAALESLAGFCAGCYVYTYLKRFGLIK